LKLDPENHSITLDGEKISGDEDKVYILLNKPKGYVTTLNDPQGRPIVTALLKGVRQRVFPVGRLDLDTEGALLLTNDGSLAQRIQHPSFEVNKTYRVKVSGQPSAEQLEELASGIELEGKMTSPAHLKIVRSGSGTTIIEITIHEGRKRQVRKMFAAIGHRVLELKRIAYGNLKLGSLASGKYRYLKSREISLIFP
jgi:23S rRNA pseudouridine2605 synthase